MELEKAIEILLYLKNDLDKIVKRNAEIDDSGIDDNISTAIETVLHELYRLQKENEELISEKTKLLLTDLAEANRLYDEENKRCMMFAIENNDLKEKLNNSISKDKIRDKIERLNKNELLNKYNYEQVKIAIDILQDLLKEE